MLKETLKKLAFAGLIFICVTALIIVVYQKPWGNGAHQEMRFQTSAKVARYFETAKQNEASLAAFLHKMPKGGDLHTHLSGAVMAESIVKNAIEHGIYFDRDNRSFSRTRPAGRHFTPSELTETFWNTAEVIEAVSMRNYELSGESGHERFFRTFYRFDEALPGDMSILREIFWRAVNQNIIHLELMTTPGDNPEWSAEFEKIRLDVLEEFRQKGQERELIVLVSYPLYRGFYTIDAFKDNVDRAMKAAAANPDLVVGVTILAPEDEWYSQLFFKQHMQIINEAVRQSIEAHERDPANNPPPPRFNLHSGELTLEYAAYESMVDRISYTIQYGHAKRIGHGTSIMWEDDVYGLLRKMRDEKIAVEICLSSSDGILKVSGADRHPFRFYWDAGVPVVLATDDEGVSRINLTMEYVKAARTFGLSYGQIKWLAFNSIEYSFLSGDSYFINGNFNTPRRNAERIAEVSRKAYMQQLLIKEFAEFEQKMESVIKEFGW
jgi:adenosine deaminase